VLLGTTEFAPGEQRISHGLRESKTTENSLSGRHGKPDRKLLNAQPRTAFGWACRPGERTDLRVTSGVRPDRIQARYVVLEQRDVWVR